MLQTDQHWPDLCAALEIQQFQHDPRFNNHQAKIANNVALIALLDEVFARRTLEEWSARLQGRNLIWGYVSTFAQVTKDPQVRENDHIVKFDHPAVGPIEVAGLPVELEKTPGQIRSAAPQLGQHTEEILLDLGYSWEDITSLKEKKVIL